MPSRNYIPSEIQQPYTLGHGFTFTTTLGTAQDALVLSRMDVANKISVIVELADAYIDFDRDATTSSMLLPINSTYSDDNITIDSRISILRFGATNARVRGIIWGRG